jgi:hypothetical protein
MDWMLDWLERNGSELESAVLKPPMISVSVKDTRYAWQVEAFTNLPQRQVSVSWVVIVSGPDKCVIDFHLPDAGRLFKAAWFPEQAD